MMHFTENTEKYKIIKEIPANSTAKTYPERHVLYLATPKNMYCKKCKLYFSITHDCTSFKLRYKRSILAISRFKTSLPNSVIR